MVEILAEIPVMVMKAVINIPEDKIVEVTEAAEIRDMVVVQILDMVAAQVLDMQAVRIRDMVEAADNLQEVSLAVAVLVGVQVAVPGEPAVIKVVVATVDPKINI